MKHQPLNSRNGRAAGWVAASLALAGFAWTCLDAGAQDERPPNDDPPPAIEDSGAEAGGAEAPVEVEVVRARMAQPGRPGHRKVRSVRVLLADGGRVDWSQQGDWIVFDRLEEDFYHIFVMQPDGSRESCVTCDQWDFRKTHALSPVWHPSGEYIAFTLQENAAKLGLDTLALATPHRGLHSEVWIITRDGKHPFRLTLTRERGAAVLDPHFSHEGDMLAWSQRVVSRGRWGEWEPHVARFSSKRGVPRLSKVRNYQPEVRAGFTAAHGFTPSDRELLISAVPAGRAGAVGRDILELDLESGAFEALTSSSEELDELATALPRSEGLVWVSDRNIQPAPDSWLPRRGDVWYMSAGGRRQERLTFFNDPGSDHYLRDALIDDLAWSPEGDRLLLHVVSAGSPGSGDVEQAIYVVEFDGVFGL